MFERYTEGARRAVFFARYEASMDGSKSIEPEHFLIGLLHDRSDPLPRLLPAEMTLDSVRKRVEMNADAREKIGTSVELPLAAEAKKVLAYALEESDRLSHRHIGNEHLLLGLLRAEGTLAEAVLREYGLDLTRLRESISQFPDSEIPASRTSGIDENVWRPLHELKARGLIKSEGKTDPPPRLEHIGIATRSIDEALKFWRDTLGLEVRHTETVGEQGVRVAMLPLGASAVELLEPTGAESPVAKFLEKRGPGIHHVAVRVADIRASLAQLKAAGARLIDEEPRVGAEGCLVAFVHPSASGGVLLELVERGPGSEEGRR
jgi:methylmalonyl-CoA/ethylmalonyl-CoA epimerase